MAAEVFKIRAMAAKLYAETKDARIESYRSMPLDELKRHIERIKGGSKPVKGKAIANGSNGKTATPTKGKGAASAKGKVTASTSAPAVKKSTAQKSAPVKGTAVQGKAKRPTTAAATKGKATSNVAKGKTTKPVAKKPVNARGPRTLIVNSAVDWTAEVPIGNNGNQLGRAGKRKEVLNALRKHQGDKDRVFKQLRNRATVYYPDRDEKAAELMLRWLIGSVAFSFVVKTGQHGATQAKTTTRKPVTTMTPKGKATASPAKGKAVAAKGKPVAAVKGRGRR